MEHLRNIPICSNALFIYKLDIQEDLALKFKKEKFKPTDSAVLQTEDLDVLKKYKKLNEEINKAISATLKETLMLKTTNYRIFNSWIIKTKPKDFSYSHIHCNSWLSGIYYPKGDPGFSVKFFNDDGSRFLIIPTEHNIFNSRNWVITPKDNFLILFFSELRHKIMPNQSKKDRFSLAFNLLPKGEIGLGDSKTVF